MTRVIDGRQTEQKTEHSCRLSFVIVTHSTVRRTYSFLTIRSCFWSYNFCPVVGRLARISKLQTDTQTLMNIGCVQ